MSKRAVRLALAVVAVGTMFQVGGCLASDLLTDVVALVGATTVGGQAAFDVVLAGLLKG